MKWYREAAAQGHAEAQSDLGRMHQYGKGVPQNHREAVPWYRKATGQGDELGQYYLGRVYDTGKLPSKDTTKLKTPWPGAISKAGACRAIT